MAFEPPGGKVLWITFDGGRVGASKVLARRPMSVLLLLSRELSGCDLTGTARATAEDSRWCILLQDGLVGWETHMKLVRYFRALSQNLDVGNPLLFQLVLVGIRLELRRFIGLRISLPPKGRLLLPGAFKDFDTALLLHLPLARSIHASLRL